MALRWLMAWIHFAGKGSSWEEVPVGASYLCPSNLTQVNRGCNPNWYLVPSTNNTLSDSTILSEITVTVPSSKHILHGLSTTGNWQEVPRPKRGGSGESYLTNDCKAVCLRVSNLQAKLLMLCQVKIRMDYQVVSLHLLTMETFLRHAFEAW